MLELIWSVANMVNKVLNTNEIELNHVCFLLQYWSRDILLSFDSFLAASTTNKFIELINK